MCFDATHHEQRAKKQRSIGTSGRNPLGKVPRVWIAQSKETVVAETRSGIGGAAPLPSICGDVPCFRRSGSSDSSETVGQAGRGPRNLSFVANDDKARGRTVVPSYQPASPREADSSQTAGSVRTDARRTKSGGGNGRARAVIAGRSKASDRRVTVGRFHV